jgi:murein L,D-transpeptidase YafK
MAGTWWLSFRVFVISTVLGVAGCTVKSPPSFAPIPPSPSSSPAPVPTRVDNDAFLPWASQEPVFIVVDKTCQVLHVYRYGRLLKTYPVVLGRNPGRKLYAGDKRTPIGLYMITGKAHHRKWTAFMLLDYPTEYDVHRYWQQVALGKVPKRGGGYPGAGSEIGIHGTDKENFNRLGINWTLGCISLFNHDMKELHTLAPVGTFVYIKE